MSVIVLAAGEGKRFVDAGYTTPKPFIDINGKTIIEWTLSSIPNLSKVDMIAIRNQDYDYSPRCYHLSKLIVTLEKLTRGNLETALITYNELNYHNFEADKPLLILDSDNYYNGSEFLEYCEMCSYICTRYSKTKEFAVCCYFDRLDDSNKWAFIKTSLMQNVTQMVEKPDIVESDMFPLVGTFYFSSGRLFHEVAKKIIEDDIMTRGEFYMTQALKRLLEEGVPVYAHKVGNVVPLGTPEDLANAMKVLK